MNDDPRANLAAVKEQLDHLTDLRAELPRLREKLGEGMFQFDRLEARVIELDSQVQSLESFSFAAIASSFTGGKQQKLDALKEELAPLTAKYRADIEPLERLNDQVRAMEHELEGFFEIEKQYRRACDVVAEEIRSQGGEAAQQLAEIEDHYRPVKAEHRTLTKAIEAAEQSEDHLDSMTHSLSSGKKKMLFRGSMGAIGIMAYGASTLRQTKGPIRLVRQGVERLKRHIDELALEDDIEINRDLRKLSISLAEIVSQLSQSMPAGYFCDMTVALPIKQDVRAALNHCTHLRNELQPQLDALKQQRRAIIESSL